MLLISNFLLTSMIICYANPILIVYQNYENSFSISQIINHEKNKKTIIIYVLIFSFLTLLYELNRNNKISFVIILFLLFGLFGVSITKENRKNLICWHNFFAICVFLSIYFFILYYTIIKSSIFLSILFIIQNIISLICLKNINNKKFWCETFLLLNFSIIYIYLHFI